MSTSKPPRTTTDAGIPAASDEFSLTVGSNGPILLQDHYLIQKMAQFNRERVPERVVHAKGGGAHGFFEVTEDISQYCKADFLQPGKRTDLFIRFSTVAGEQGSADTVRDPRGFAIKFYTDEGNYDMVGNNTPVFFVRDPSKFQDFIHSQKRLPDTHLRSNDMQWDFWTLSPESAHQVTWLMGDRGTPRSWRHMNGYSSHTYLWENAGGDKFWVKYHFKTDQGVECFTDDEAKAMVAEEPDFHLRDLHDAIATGDAPQWNLMMQIMPFADAEVNSYNKDGAMRYRHNGDTPVYAPNSFGGPVADPGFAETVWGVEGGDMIRAAYQPHAEDDDFGQAGTMWETVLDDDARDRLVDNIVGHATTGVSSEMQRRVVDYWTKVHTELGARVGQGISHAGGDTSNGATAANTKGTGRPVGASASTGL